MTANLLDLDLEGLAAFCEQLGEKRFRAVQLFRWIHQKGESDPSRMTDLAKSLREKLPSAATVQTLPVLSRQDSADGTIKWLFDVGDGNAVETVFIPEEDRDWLLSHDVAAVYTPKDFDIARIMREVAELAAAHRNN